MENRPEGAGFRAFDSGRQGGTENPLRSRKSRTKGLHPILWFGNTYWKFTSLKVFGGATETNMELEEAIITALLAVGMIVLAAMTILLFF